jgi:hypothetical protein
MELFGEAVWRRDQCRLIKKIERNLMETEILNYRDFVKWPSIGAFKDTYKHAQRCRVQWLHLRGKIKLHGTKAAIRIHHNLLTMQEWDDAANSDTNAIVGHVITAEKRTSDVTVDADNAGFAAFVQNKCVPLIDPNFQTTGITIHGEWAGPGVQKNDAISQIDHKRFFVFAIVTHVDGKIILDPDDIAALLCTSGLLPHEFVHVLPWATEETVLNMLDQKACEEFITAQVTYVDEVIGAEDPYVKETFGVSDHGEGLVFYDCGDLIWRDWMFKVKSEAHSVNKDKKRDRVAPAKPGGIEDFIEMFFTEQRFEQMLDEALGGIAAKKDTGAFLAAVMRDVLKESTNELELADFEWKDVARYAIAPTKLWFFAKADAL